MGRLLKKLGARIAIPRNRRKAKLGVVFVASQK
jgi:hypothetical protein